MSRSADARAEVALLEALGQGPLDVLDLVQALRKDAGWVLKGGEGVVHVLLHRLVRTQRVVVGPPGRVAPAAPRSGGGAVLGRLGQPGAA